MHIVLTYADRVLIDADIVLTYAHIVLTNIY